MYYISKETFPTILNAEFEELGFWLGLFTRAGLKVSESDKSTEFI